MSDETTPTPAPVVATPVVKPWYAQYTNYAGAFVGIVGNALPYITPDFLTSIGVSATAAHTISSIVAVILVAYKETVKPVEQPK